MSLLEISELTQIFGDNTLYKNAELTLNKGEHLGIVGQNGTGKSTLIKICTEQVIPDMGRVVWQPGISIGYLDQYAEIDHCLRMKDFLKKAFDYLYEDEEKLTLLYEKAADGDEKALKKAAQNISFCQICSFLVCTCCIWIDFCCFILNYSRVIRNVF